MQLGRRWPVGGEPLAGLPSDVLAALVSAEQAGLASGFWTLTWLEGRPRLVADNGFQLGAEDSSDDDW